MVYAITRAGQDGWLARPTDCVLRPLPLVARQSLAWELRHPEPLMRFGILRIKTVSGANIAGFILNIVSLSMFLSLTLYMQLVLDFSAMETGVAYLAVALSDRFVDGRCTAREPRRCQARAGRRDEHGCRRACVLRTNLRWRVGSGDSVRSPPSAWASASRSFRSRLPRSPESKPREVGPPQG